MSEIVRSSPPDVDYTAAAELFPTRNRRGRGRPMKYMRFDTAADAIRFAVEELPPDMLLGAHLEIDEKRFDSGAIRKLYDSPNFPPRRRAKVA